MSSDFAGDLAGRSVLVTGGAGFIGSHIAGALTDYCDVTVLDDLSVGTRANVPARVEFVQGDVRDATDLAAVVEGADVIFHQAALSDVGTSIRSPVEAHRRTASGTVKLLDAARRADARVVTASSAAVYGGPDTLPIRETDQKRPTSPYGIDKLAADQYTRAYADLYGLPTVSLRYFNVYGPGMGKGGYSGVVSAFLDRARNDAILTVDGDGTQTRDFVHVDDIVRANLLAATTDETGRAYNIGTGTGVSIQEVAEHVTRLLNADSEVVHGDPREGDIKHSRAAIGRARSQLGYEPSLSFVEGLETLVEPAGVTS